MPWQIEFTAKASRQFDTLPPHVRARIAPHMDALADNPRPPGCKKLKGAGDFWRIRIGDYRVICQIQDRALIVLIVTLGDRKDIYQ